MCALKVRPDLKNNPTPFHFLKVMYPGIGKITVGKNQLLTGERFDPCSFQAYVFDHPIFVIDYHKIPYFKGLIKKYHKVIEDIAHDILGSQCNSNTTNT